MALCFCGELSRLSCFFNCQLHVDLEFLLFWPLLWNWWWHGKHFGSRIIMMLAAQLCMTAWFAVFTCTQQVAAEKFAFFLVFCVYVIVMDFSKFVLLCGFECSAFGRLGFLGVWHTSHFQRWFILHLNHVFTYVEWENLLIGQVREVKNTKKNDWLWDQPFFLINLLSGFAGIELQILMWYPHNFSILCVI